MVDRVVRTGRATLVTRAAAAASPSCLASSSSRACKILAFGQVVGEGAAQAEHGEFASDTEVKDVIDRKQY